jgi:hypothetical protein
MRLCALLGIHSRHALKRLLTHRDYLDWQALYRVDPWGEDRADLRAGIIASAAISPYAKKGQTPRPVDFMPYAKPPGPRRQTAEQIKQIATSIAGNWNRAVERMTKKKAIRKANDGN